jgi:hypothetical protein
MKRRTVGRCAGVLAPERVYTVEGCLRAAGLGHESLAQARRSGLVRPIVVGRRVYYLGSELVEWVKSQGVGAER